MQYRRYRRELHHSQQGQQTMNVTSQLAAMNVDSDGHLQHQVSISTQTTLSEHNDGTEPAIQASVEQSPLDALEIQTAGKALWRPRVIDPIGKSLYLDLSPDIS
jgi:hypothetical protein